MKETEVTISTKSDYAWVQDFFVNGGSINLPAGRVLLLAAQNRAEPSAYLGKGVAALLISVGSGDADHDAIGIGVDNRFVLAGRWWVQGPTNNKPWTQFTDADVDMCVDVYVNSRNIKYVTSDLDEEYHGGTLANYADNPSKWVRLQKRIGSKLAAKGQRWYDNYGGSVPEPQRISISQARNVLSSGANALAWLKDGSETGGRSNQNPYWAESLYNFDVHTILNIYYRGADDDHVRVYYLLFVLATGRLAMDQTGSGKSLMAYTEGVNSEFTRYSHYWRRDLDGGGNVVCANFPSPFYGYMLFQYFSVYLFNVENGCWKEPAMFGTNPAICMPEDVNTPGFNYHVDGANPPRQQPVNWGNYNEHDVPYPNRPLGYENSPMDAADWFESAYNHVGNANRHYPAISVEGGNSATPGPGDSMIADCYEKKLPYAFYGTDGAGKRWVCALYVRQENGPNRISASFNLAGITVTLTLYSGVPRLRLYDQTA